MAFDSALPMNTLETVAAREVSNQSSTLFRRGEGLAPVLGALAFGALTGVGLFFAIGRVAPWMPAAAAFATYGGAMALAAFSTVDVIRSRDRDAIVLFGLHLAALAVWSLAIMLWTPMSWQLWLCIPAALIALIQCLVTTRLPASAIYRVSAHVALISASAAYQWMWMLLHA